MQSNMQSSWSEIPVSGLCRYTRSVLSGMIDFQSCRGSAECLRFALLDDGRTQVL